MGRPKKASTGNIDILVKLVVDWMVESVTFYNQSKPPSFVPLALKENSTAIVAPTRRNVSHFIYDHSKQ